MLFLLWNNRQAVHRSTLSFVWFLLVFIQSTRAAERVRYSGEKPIVYGNMQDVQSLLFAALMSSRSTRCSSVEGMICL